MNRKKRILRTAASLLTFMAVAGPATASQFKALLFTKTAGWKHDSIPAGVSAVKALARLHHFDVVHSDTADVFNPSDLNQFDVIIFLSTTGDVLNERQQDAFQKFIQQGKGYVGVHSAADSEHDWSWYRGLVGRTFVIHPKVQSAKIEVLEDRFPGTEYMPSRFLWTEEYYGYSDEHSDSLNYILSVDEKSYNPAVDWGEVKSGGMGEFHPLAWYQQYDGGRAFYTGLGHLSASYSDVMFQSHLYGGIYWAATGKGIDIE